VLIIFIATSNLQILLQFEGGGNVTLFGSHLIDLITYLTGQRAVRVHGITRAINAYTSTINGTRRITSPDFSVIQMEMDSGELANILCLKLYTFTFHSNNMRTII